MPKTANISLRTTPETKKTAEKIFKKLGITTTEAVNMFYRQVILNQGLPFDVKIPNPDTLKALMDTEKSKDLIKSKNAKDMFAKLGI